MVTFHYENHTRAEAEQYLIRSGWIRWTGPLLTWFWLDPTRIDNWQPFGEAVLQQCYRDGIPTPSQDP